MYQVDPNANNANADAASIVLSDASSDSTYEEESVASSVSTLYEEQTVASGLSAPANLNGKSQGLQQLAFASSLQLMAAGPHQQSPEEAAAYEAL